MKDYLNRDERIQMIYLKKYIDQSEKVAEEWGKRNNLTKEELKALRTSATWGLKAFNSITERLSDQTLKTFLNSLLQAYIRVEDKFAMEVFNKNTRDNLNEAYERKEEYYKLVEKVLEVNCCNCNKNHNECMFAEEFEKRCIPEPTGYDLGNCRYSYTLPEVKENENGKYRKNKKTT